MQGYILNTRYTNRSNVYNPAFGCIKMLIQKSSHYWADKKISLWMVPITIYSCFSQLLPTYLLPIDIELLTLNPWDTEVSYKASVTNLLHNLKILSLIYVIFIHFLLYAQMCLCTMPYKKFVIPTYFYQYFFKSKPKKLFLWHIF